VPHPAGTMGMGRDVGARVPGRERKKAGVTRVRKQGLAGGSESRCVAKRGKGLSPTRRHAGWRPVNHTTGVAEAGR
jgi:hypothetical protein